MKKYIYIAVIAILSTVTISAQQFDVNADLRARFENRNGYGTLKPDTEKAASFISQRTRLLFDYSFKNIKLRVSPQNVKIWGDVATTSKTDANSAFHEAYGEIKINEKLSFKLGDMKLEDLCNDIMKNKLCKLLILKLPYNYDLDTFKHKLSVYKIKRVLFVFINI